MTEFDYVYGYSRAQAIAHGVLVAVPDDLLKEVGIKYPVALTDSLWQIVHVADDERRDGQSTTGRLWDVLGLLRLAMARADGPEVQFIVDFWDQQRNHTEQLRALCHPGDSLEPVITVGLKDDPGW